MLTDDNLEYIEWKKATIFVHDPPGLEKNLLPRYFRHSNYSSFVRLLAPNFIILVEANYFSPSLATSNELLWIQKG